MRKLVILALALALFFGLSVYVLGAEAGTPVYLEGRLIARAVERQGTSYLPMREVFQQLGGEVSWLPQERRVVASLTGGRVLTMQVGARIAEVESRLDGAAAGAQLGLEQPAYLERGTVYLPLRFVAEQVLGLGVDYREGAVHLSYPWLRQGEYRLNLYNGELWQGERRLATLELPGYMWYQPASIGGDLQVRETEPGTLLVSADGMLHGALTYSLRWYCWVGADGQSVGDYASAMLSGELPDFVIDEVDGNLVYFPGPGGELNCIDLGTGEQVLCLPGFGRCWWARGDVLLIRNTGNYSLYNLTSKEQRELIPYLLTPAAKAEVNAFLRAEYDPRMWPDEQSLERGFWEYLGYTHMAGTMEAFPELRFVEEKDGQLWFNIVCHYVKTTETEAYTDVKLFPVSVSLTELGL